VSVDFY